MNAGRKLYDEIARLQLGRNIGPAFRNPFHRPLQAAKRVMLIATCAV